MIPLRQTVRADRSLLCVCPQSQQQPSNPTVAKSTKPAPKLGRKSTYKPRFSLAPLTEARAPRKETDSNRALPRPRVCRRASERVFLFSPIWLIVRASVYWVFLTRHVRFHLNDQSTLFPPHLGLANLGFPLERHPLDRGVFPPNFTFIQSLGV